MRTSFLMFFLVLAGVSQARESLRLNTTPTLEGFVSPVILVFPGINSAPTTNPAALTSRAKITAFQGAFSPPLKSGDTTNLFAGMALSSPMAGVGVGFQQSTLNGDSTEGGFAGVGFSIEPVSIGLALRDNDLSTGLAPQVDLGLLVGEGKNGSGLAFGAVLYDTNSAARLGVGFGYRSSRKHHFEANVILPSFSESSLNYTLTLASTIYADPLGVYLRTSYFTLSRGFVHTVGTVIWLGNNLNLIVQWSSPRTGTLGATIVF